MKEWENIIIATMTSEKHTLHKSEEKQKKKKEKNENRNQTKS